MPRTWAWPHPFYAVDDLDECGTCGWPSGEQMHDLEPEDDEWRDEG